jgi:hypothetical protein
MSRLNIDMELVRTFTPEQYARGPLAWGWLRPRPMEPIFASAFGDVFSTTSSSWTSLSSSRSLVSFTIRSGGRPQIPRSPALRSAAQESYGY